MSKTYKKRKIKAKFAGAILIVIVLLALTMPVLAWENYLTNFNSKYGTATTRLNTCGLCHINPAGGGSRNSYGTSFENNGHNFTKIEPLDSDGDKYTNIIEIRSRTFPGNATDKPKLPANITNLKNITYKPKYINWTWTDPKSANFAKVMIYINGKFKTNVTKGKQFYNATGLIPNTLYKISTHTVDTIGKINNTWVNKTARTAPLIARVSIIGFSYSPQTLKVSRYTTVIWKNNDMTNHTVTSDTGLWNSGNIMPGKSYSRRFDSVGIFRYHCNIHPTMKGTVNVT